MFKTLTNVFFLRLWLAQIISQLGDGVTRIAAVFLIAQQGDPFLIGLAIFAQMLPVGLFGSFFGPLADRLPKHRLMIVADLYRLVVILLMLFVMDQVWLLLGLIFLHGVGTALFEPARASSIPILVGEQHVSDAIGLSQSTTAAMQLVGPALGGVVLSSGSVSAAFVLDAMTFLLSALFISGIHVLNHHKASERPESYFASLRFGYLYVIGNGPLLMLLIFLLPVQFSGGVLNTNFNAVLLHAFKVSPFHFGMLEGVVGGGAMIGALASARFVKWFRPSLLLLCGTGLLALTNVAIWLVDKVRAESGVAAIYFWVVMIGLFNAMLNVALDTLILMTASDEVRGRVTALLQSAAYICGILGILLGGWFGKKLGVIPSTAMGGALLFLSVIVVPFLKGSKQLHKVMVQQESDQ